MYTDCLGTLAKIETVNGLYRLAFFDDFGIFAEYDKPKYFIGNFETSDDALAWLGESWIPYEI